MVWTTSPRDLLGWIVDFDEWARQVVQEIEPPKRIIG